MKSLKLEWAKYSIKSSHALCNKLWESGTAEGKTAFGVIFMIFTWRRRNRQQSHWRQLKHISIHSVIRRCIKLLLNYDILQMILALVLFYLNLIYFMIKKTSLASAAAWNWAATSLTMHRDSDWNKSVKRKDQHRFHSEMTQNIPSYLNPAVLGPHHINVTFREHNLTTGWWK